MIKNNEKISCIVTVYNRFDYVRNIIKCLKNQTLQIDELILADDGSKENIFETIKDLLEDCKFKVIHIFQEDIAFRLARSRNNAVRVSNSDFLIFFDQDVIFSDDFIEKVYSSAERKRILMTKVAGSSENQKKCIDEYLSEGKNFEFIYSNIFGDSVTKSLRKITRKDKFYNLLYKLKLRTRGAKMAGAFFALYKDDFININGFDEKYIGWGEEDDDFCNRFYKYGGIAKPLDLEIYPVHMYHPFAPSKGNSPNWEYYQKRKKEISKNNYKPEYGYNNTLGEDKYRATILKEINDDN